MDKINLERFPANGTFELTARCNLKCKMCLIRIDNKRMAELGGRERTADEWIRMAREVCDAGTIGLLLTGGEPMLRPDFIEIYEAIAQMGFIITLYTNATLITPEIMEVLRKFPPHKIGITAYGASSETYEKVTGDAKAYHRMIEGVELLRQLPSKIIIRTTLIKDNLDDLDNITQWAFKMGKDIEFNVSRVVIKPVRGGIAHVEDCRLTPEQNVAMLVKRKMDFIINPLKKYIEENPPQPKEGNETKRNTEDPIASINEKKLTLYGCDAGMNAYTITWDGKLVGCQLLGDCWTEPFEDGFEAAWKQFPDKVKLPPVSEECIGCKLSCNACPATRLAETGSMGELPEYLCKESKLAYKMQERLINDLKNIIKEGEMIEKV